MRKPGWGVVAMIKVSFLEGTAYLIAYVQARRCGCD